MIPDLFKSLAPLIVWCWLVIKRVVHRGLYLAFTPSTTRRQHARRRQLDYLAELEHDTEQPPTPEYHMHCRKCRAERLERLEIQVFEAFDELEIRRDPVAELCRCPCGCGQWPGVMF